MEIHGIGELRKAGESYLEFLRTQFLSAGVYRLAAGATDEQQPHLEEEIYFVSTGRARFTGGGRDVAVAPGDVLFVPAHEVHRFYDIREDLEVLVIFAPPERLPAP